MLGDLYDRLFDGDSPENVKRWRMLVSHLLFVVTLFCIFMAMAITIGVPMAGRLVWNEAPAVRVDIERLKLEQADQRAILTRIASSVDLQLAQAKAAEIRLLLLKRCGAAIGGAERESLTREIEQRQDEYKSIRGEWYRTPACADL